jgi:hypothetical protein
MERVEKQLTAVEWYCEKSVILSEDLRTGKIDFIKWFKEQADILKQAKEMEKQHIVEAHLKGQREDIDFINEAKKEAEQYYNETFKSE